MTESVFRPGLSRFREHGAEKALSINSKEPVAHMIAALCCEALGRPSEADTHVRAALAADPASVQVIVQREPSLGVIVTRVQ